jgi:S1-C subfamily serine protease
MSRSALLLANPGGPARWLGAVVAVLLLATLPAAPVAAQPSSTEEERAAALVRPAVVYLEVEWEGWVRDQRDGQLWDTESVYFVNRCTGFVVSDAGSIVTAGHCVDPGLEGVAPVFYQTIAERLVNAGLIAEEEFSDAVTVIGENSVIEGVTAGDPAIREVYVQRGVAVSGLTTGEAFPARVVDLSPLSDGDVALLKVDQTELAAVEIASPGEVPVGTPILAMGYPGSADDISDATLEPSSKDGQISNLRTEGGVPFYETSAAMTGGMSGGPVVNLDGQVIGLVSSGPAGESQAFNFAAASSLITEMLARNGVTNQLSGLDQEYREGLDAYFDGRYSEAIEKFDVVLSQVPAHQQAQEYRQLAVQRQQTEGDRDRGGSGWLVAVAAAGLGLVVLAGVVALVVLLVARSRRPRPAGPGHGPLGGGGGPPPPSPAPYPPPSGQPAAGPGSPAPGPGSPGDGQQPAPAPAPVPVPGRDPVAGPEVAETTPMAAGASTTATSTEPAGTAPKFCSHCGAAATADGRFCGSCGSPIP